ncbi:hypothetical protein LBMAG56_51890 [Verrucomicrobiota bacterium]|nr:hypothetical protein LBMAG56_51890 [Verrucomicrobiota bacterium]
MPLPLRTLVFLSASLCLMLVGNGHAAVTVSLNTLNGIPTTSDLIASDAARDHLTTSITVNTQSDAAPGFDSATLRARFFLID